MSTLRYTQQLEQAGFSRKQAETTVTIIERSMKDEFTTKHEFEKFRADMAFEFKLLRAEMKQFEQSLFIKLGSLMLALFTIFFGLIQWTLGGR